MTPLCRTQNSLFLSVTSTSAPFREGAPQPSGAAVSFTWLCAWQSAGLSHLWPWCALLCLLPRSGQLPLTPSLWTWSKRGALAPLGAALRRPRWSCGEHPASREAGRGRGVATLRPAIGWPAPWPPPLPAEGTGHVFLIVERLLWVVCLTVSRSRR